MIDPSASNGTSSPPEGATPTPPPPPRRSPGHRGQDVRDTVAELAARAQEISLEAGSKMSSALKDVINAAAGITSFALESARDLVQYMVRRGQMTQQEADKLIREAEEASQKRGRSHPKSDGAKKPLPTPSIQAAATPPPRPVAKPTAPTKAAAPKAKLAASKKPERKKPAVKAAKKPAHKK